MTAIVPLAGNTIRELMRNKLLYLIGLFAGLLILASLFLIQISIGQWERIINDVSLAAIHVSGVAVAILIGVNLVAGEVDRRTVYVTLSKPVSRVQFLVGKYIGLCVTMFLLVAVMGGLLITLLLLIGNPPTMATIGALILTYVELCILAAFAMVFSAFTTQTLGVMFTASIFVIGELAGDLRTFADRAPGSPWSSWLTFLSNVLPNLDKLNLKAQAANHLVVAPAFVAWSAAYGLCYAAIVLVIAAIVFSRRDFR
jgi:ABC-type transport system involved in multi-copper enzyme maturation permease subunit